MQTSPSASASQSSSACTEEIFVAKITGSVLEDEQVMRGILQDQQQLFLQGIAQVLVHGGGRQLDARLPHSVRHPTTQMRITDAEDICRITEEIERITQSISGHCTALGIAHRILSPSVVRGMRKDGHGETGDVQSVLREEILAALDVGEMPILSFAGVSEEGDVLNLDADAVAAEVAQVLHASRLFLLTNVPGILNAQNALISRMYVSDLLSLLREQRADGSMVITKGMLAKVEASLRAVRGTVSAVHILEAGMQALSDAVRGNVGTLLTRT